jgi:hypothetical protein
MTMPTSQILFWYDLAMGWHRLKIKAHSDQEKQKQREKTPLIPKGFNKAFRRT